MKIFDILNISYKDTSCFSNLVLDYLSGNQDLSQFYKYKPDLKSFKYIIEDKNKEQTNRKLLFDVINEQYSLLKQNGAKISDKTLQNIELLKDKNTFTVTTGHQLCLFTGPLYFIYKIITAINLAEELKGEFVNFNIVPVMWLATEDHDFAEINHAHIFNKTITWNVEENIAGVAPAGFIEPSSMESTLKELQTIAGESAEAEEIVNMFKDAYNKNKNLSAATHYIINELFGSYGLVVLDPADERLKREFSHIIKEDIINNHSYKLAGQTSDALQNKGYPAQVNPREINFFYLTAHERRRIIRDGNEYQVLETNVRFSEKKLLEEIDKYPGRFSPNVVLRPLYQEKILPNLAYIGGGAELAYWMEYKKIFDHYEVNYPALILRNSAMIIDSPAKERMIKTGFSAQALFASSEELIKHYIENNTGDELDITKEKNELTDIFNSIATKAGIVDSTLKPLVESEHKKMLKTMEQIEKRFVRAEKKKQEIALNQLLRLKDKLFPNGTLQERHDNFIPFYIRYGKDFISDLKTSFKPFSNTFTLLSHKSN